MKIIGAYYQGKQIKHFYLGRYANQSLFVAFEREGTLHLIQHIEDSSNRVEILGFSDIDTALNVSYDQLVLGILLSNIPLTLVINSDVQYQVIQLLANQSPPESIICELVCDVAELNLTVNSYLSDYQALNYQVTVDMPVIKVANTVNKILTNLFNWRVHSDSVVENDVKGFLIILHFLKLTKEINLGYDSRGVSTNLILRFLQDFSDTRNIDENDFGYGVLIEKYLLSISSSTDIKFTEIGSIKKVLPYDINLSIEPVQFLNTADATVKILGSELITASFSSINLSYDNTQVPGLLALSRSLPALASGKSKIKLQKICCRPVMVTHVWLNPQEVMTPDGLEMLEIYQSQETYTSEGTLYIN